MGLNLSVDEIVETLKRSSLTSVIVEGKDDIIIYRWIEEVIGIEQVNFFPCGGRDKLLRVYDRRAEFPNLITIFVADKDAYIYSNYPAEYSDVIWTNGYSIENDLYTGRKIESLLSLQEKTDYDISLNNFIEYYAFEVEKYLRGEACTFSHHPQQVINEQNILNNQFLESVSYTPANKNTVENLKQNYDVLIRGKSLFALLTRILSKQGRQIKHSKNSLLEHCFRVHQSENFLSLIDTIKARISA